MLRMIPRPIGPSTSFSSDPLPQAGRRRPPQESGAQRLMRPPFVVQPEVFSQPPMGLKAIGISLQVNFLALHRPPQPLHEYVVLVPAPSVHVDPHRVFLHYLRELQAGELRWTGHLSRIRAESKRLSREERMNNVRESPLVVL